MKAITKKIMNEEEQGEERKKEAEVMKEEKEPFREKETKEKKNEEEATSHFRHDQKGEAFGGANNF